MTPPPVVSVVMPLYNGGALVAEALASVQAQSFQAWELVVVDDGSTDDSPATVEGASRQDPRIRLLRQENSGGPARPRNRGIEASRGEYVCFLDADDLFHPDKLQALVAAMETLPEAHVVFSDMNVFTQDQQPTEGYSYLGRAGWHDKVRPHLAAVEGDLHRCRDDFYRFMSTTITSITTQTVMVRREALARFEAPFDESLVIGQDIDLWFRLALDGPVLFLDRSLAYYRRHEGNRTGNAEKALIGFIQAHSRNLARAGAVLDSGALRTMRRRICENRFILGYHYVRHRRFAEARQNYLASLPGVDRRKVVTAYLKSWIHQGIHVLGLAPAPAA